MVKAPGTNCLKLLYDKLLSMLWFQIQVASLHDGVRLASASSDKSVRVWDPTAVGPDILRVDNDFTDNYGSFEYF
jgi:WD40 repeat protein